MKLVVDTNVVFSALLNPSSPIGLLLLDSENRFEFYGPNLLLEEIEYYSDKIALYTKLNENDLIQAKNWILDSIRIISETFISENSWKEAFMLTEIIDPDDTPFVALAIDLGAKLWTGDKKLTNFINQMNTNIIITTEQVKKLVIE